MANEITQTGGADVDFTPDTNAGASSGGTTGNGTADNGGQSRGVGQFVKEEATKLTGQAGDGIRTLADTGKTRATGMLDELAKAIEDAAGTIDEKVGEQFGGYARSASGSVTNFAESLRNKEVDDLLDDAREFVRKSPGVAIGAAAAIGFVVARLLRSSIDEGRGA